MGYQPSFTITEDMLNRVAEIVELLSSIANVGNLDKLPRLRRSGRIKSIYSSLAIEKNTLTIEQMTTIINGKQVIGPPNEIQEVKNAFEAYQEIANANPYNIKDLLKIHQIMMRGLVDNPGVFRSRQVGVFDEKGNVVHIAPPAINVPTLIKELFEWLKNSKTHPLIKSCVFHYEFEFIHPFPDGNGRIGRLWQTIILAAWKSVFAWIPIESIIKKRQKEYYDAITSSTSQSSSNAFIIYMLEMIKLAVEEIINNAIEHINHISDGVRKLLAVLQDYPMSTHEIMKRLNLKSRASFRKNYLQPAIEAGLVTMTIPNKPTSGNQRYLKK